MLRRHQTIRMLEIPQSTVYVCRNVDARYRLSCINAVEQFWCYVRKVTVSYYHSYNKTQIKNKQYRLILIFARHLLIQHDTIDKSIHVIASQTIIVRLFGDFAEYVEAIMVVCFCCHRFMVIYATFPGFRGIDNRTAVLSFHQEVRRYGKVKDDSQELARLY